MRDPVIGETLKCGVCYSSCEAITQEWIDKNKDNLEGLYSESQDCFLTYDGCESNPLSDVLDLLL